MARINAVLRRASAKANESLQEEAPPPPKRGQVVGFLLAFEEFLLNPRLRSLSTTEGKPIRLTGSKFDLLLALVEVEGKSLSRDELLDRTRSREWSPFDRSVDVLIGRIRRKIEKDPAKPSLIKTVRNVGYILTAPVRRQILTSDPAERANVISIAP